MHIDCTFFRDVETEPITFVRHFNLSEFICDGSRKRIKTVLDLVVGVICIKKVVQRRKRVVQTDIFCKETKLCLLFFDNVNKILFKFIVTHVGTSFSS